MTAATTSFDFDACARRIWAAYRDEPADRIPLLPPIPWPANGDIDTKRFGDWRDEEGFRSVARLVQRHCDVRPPFNNNVPRPSIFANTSYMRFLEASPEHIEQLPPERITKERTRQTTLLHTPKGDLKWVYEADDGIFTQWDMEKPIKTPHDVEKLLSVPYRFAPPDTAQYDAYRQARAGKGRYWMGGEGVTSMVAMLCGMMDFELLLEWVLTEQTLVRMLADEWLRRVGDKVAFLEAQGVGPFWHFNGVERASPPMMGPRQWEAWVVPYDGELMRRIKRDDPEARIHVHCHGKVGTLLNSFMAMGVDSTDPVEPPHQGDIEFAEAKQRCAGRMTLYGNIEFVDLERGTPDRIEELVRRAIEVGGKSRMVLMPSSGPHARPTERFIANATRYIEAGLKYGVLE